MAKDEEQTERRRKPNVEDFEHPKAGKTTMKKEQDENEMKNK
jgi:hypothetical protein